MDWNSFFSTISQASASMIGVILAFLVSRIISEGSDYDRLEYDGQALVDESIDLKARIQSMDFDWHDTRIFEEHDFDEEQADLAALHNTSDEVKIDFIKQALPRLYYPENFISSLNAKINASVESTRRSRDQSLGIAGYASINTPLAALRPPNTMLWQRLNTFEDNFESISFRVQSVIRRHKNLARALQRNISDMSSLSRSLLLLAPIIIMTVIYPLHFLPVPSGSMPSLAFDILALLDLLLSVKGFFLIGLSCLSIGLLVFLALFCERHVSVYRSKIRAINEYYVDTAWYSDRIGEFNPLILSPIDPFGSVSTSE